MPNYMLLLYSEPPASPEEAAQREANLPLWIQLNESLEKDGLLVGADRAGVQADRHLLAGAFDRVDDDVRGIGVDARHAGQRDRDAALLEDLAADGLRRRLAHLDAAAGELPVAVVGAPHEEHPVATVAHDGVDHHHQTVDGRRVRIVEVLVDPGHGRGSWPPRRSGTTHAR